jgi:diaminopimelate epimerase
MDLHFYKYEGAGNDFILADNRKNVINHQNPLEMAALCNRHFGIGADGIIFLQDAPGFDFEMIYYNADGKPSSMCGNGGRCITAFAHKLGIIGNETNFLAVDGPHYAKIAEKGDWVSLQMKDVDQISRDGDAFVLNTGSPHYVEMCTGLKSKNVYSDGKTVRFSDKYAAEGINVNFVEELDDRYFVRTYERGVEDETFACGTGATAVALAMARKKHQTGHITTPIDVQGGNLRITFDFDGDRFTNVFLEGPATFVFEGDIVVPAS